MISIKELYEDVAKDSANEYENGSLLFDRFNRFSKRAELLLMDWLTGGAAPDNLPTPYLTQKNKDWLSPFIKQAKGQVVGGEWTRPADYYQKDNFYRLGPPVEDDTDCNEDKEPSACNTTIHVYDGKEFNYRCNTNIDELKPSYNKPIAKQIGKTFQVAPLDIGSVGLDYIRYPLFAYIVGSVDQTFNEPIVGPTSRDYEWDEAVRSILIFLITDMFANNTANGSLKGNNVESGKTERERR